MQEIHAEKLADDDVDEMILETDVDDDSQRCTAESDAVAWKTVRIELIPSDGSATVILMEIGGVCCLRNWS